MAEDARPLERLAGPSGTGSHLAGWDSAVLELCRAPTSTGGAEQPDAGDSSEPSSRRGRFSLELWRFYEGWRVPADELEEHVAGGSIVGDEAAGGTEGQDAAPTSFRAPGQPRASVLEREETRVTYAGDFATTRASALTFDGFRKARLNQAFVERPELPIDGLPTWWSQDGRYFMYFAREYSHWKVNAVRMASGDGCRAVAEGGRRAGHGFAHSGFTELAAPRAAEAAELLASSDGWFELQEDAWMPVVPAVEAVAAWSFGFEAASVVAEELVASGDVSSKAKQQAGPVAYQGVRFHARDAGPLLLQLPPAPDLLVAEEEPQLADSPQQALQESKGLDPTMVLLQPERSSKL